MRVLVTGGAGFIGSHLVERLAADGREVVVFDNLSTGRAENLSAVRDRVRWMEGDLRDRVAVARAVEGVEVVYHQAALSSVAHSVEDPREVAEVNVGGTLSLLLAARGAGVRRVVFASSSSVYGDSPDLPKTEAMPPAPRSPYAATKVAGEAWMAAFAGSYGLETVSLRYFNVYGPRQSPRSRYAAVVPCFLEAALEGRRPVVHGDGRQTRDFTFVADVVDAAVRAAEADPAPEGPVNLGGGRQVSVLDLWAAVARATGARAAPVHDAARPGDVRDSLADLRRARDLLGWSPSTSLDEGIARLAAWSRGPEGRAFAAADRDSGDPA
jgi:UDP-glucose 4-epimerase